MTDRQLIAEYILQGIKYFSMVEIKFSTNNQVIKGYILDRDVFRQSQLEFENELRGILYPHLKEEVPQKVTIQILKEKSILENKILENFPLNLNLLPPEVRIINPKDIIYIKKLED